jgi:Domain of unknown function (DUF4150)/GHH signature containing HNH/Endo VII superfamily nuclease toxin  2
MANQVYANGREIACKAADGKSICAFPDVCFTPPQTPGTPPGVPIPYPNTGFARDTTSGSTTVKISGKEVILKNKSYFKRSIGDEAGCAPKKGIVTSVNRGKIFFASWSMDVKYEGENVVRHQDLTTHNHASLPANAPPQIHTSLVAAFRISECQEAVSRVLDACSPWDEKATCPEEHEDRIDKALADRDAARTRFGTNHPSYRAAQHIVNDEYTAYTGQIMRNDCHKAMRCILMTYRDMNAVKCRHQTPEHLIEQSSAAGVGSYRLEQAPCAFTEGTSWHLGDHGVMSAARKDMYADWRTQNPNAPYDTAKAADIGATVHRDSNIASDCNKDCTEKQLLQGHRRMGVNENDPLTPTQTGIADASERARRQEIIRLQQEQLLEDQ